MRVPGDKSISHRGLILAALADGSSRIRGILQSADIHSTAAALRALGVALPEVTGEMVVEGVGLRGLRRAQANVECGNSGTTARLVAGIVAAIPARTRFTGDSSLSRRPMRRVAEPLSAMGARIEMENGDGLPMIVHGGALRTIEWTTETASAQVKSAILLAALVAGVPVTVREPVRSRDHTERLLSAAGVSVMSAQGDAGATVTLCEAERLAPLDLTVPGDPSSAAFFIAAGLLADGGELTIPGVCVNGTRAGFLSAVRRMGGRLSIEDVALRGGEPVGTVTTAPSQLTAIQIEGAEVPSMIDELPMLACLATRAEGRTVIAGAGELRVKESDRIRLVVENLRAIGANAEERSDGIVVQGSDRPLRGAIRTEGDHRIAMAFGVLSALHGGALAIDDRDCVAVSFPSFWRDLERVTGVG
ncbi:MAG: 3-phosphoshikimate 1-carboxyvinyltransferase [Gemmatimonadota bacterium]|nr:3-phosphoshikimate 1-carboxyvinyltransferase [Gemmatimonadota bacterium]